MNKKRTPKKECAVTKHRSESRIPFPLHLKGLSFQEAFTSYDIRSNSFYSLHRKFQYKGRQLWSLVGSNQQHLKINTLTQRCVTFLLWNYWCRATQWISPTAQLWASELNHIVRLSCFVLVLTQAKPNISWDGWSVKKKRNKQ